MMNSVLDILSLKYPHGKVEQAFINKCIRSSRKKTRVKHYIGSNQTTCIKCKTMRLDETTKRARIARKGQISQLTPDPLQGLSLGQRPIATKGA